MTTDLACRQLVELLTDFLDDDMTPDVRRDVQAHLAECSSCQSALEQLRATVEALGELPVDRPSRSFRRRLLDEFRRICH